MTAKGPSNLTRHLKTQHANHIGRPVQPEGLSVDGPRDEPMENECPASASQPKPVLGAISRSRPNQVISTYFQRPMPVSAAEKTHKLVLKLFTKFYLPFHVLNSQEWRAFVRSLNDNYVTMNRKSFSNAFLTSIYNEVKEKGDDLNTEPGH